MIQRPQRSTDQPRERVNAEVAFGEPARELLSAAERLGVDLIIMGRRDGGRFRRAILGSVVESVLHGAVCPVLVVPEPAAGSADGGA
jgi:nucleotide-binding universal stress UspA family protein